MSLLNKLLNYIFQKFYIIFRKHIFMKNKIITKPLLHIILLNFNLNYQNLLYPFTVLLSHYETLLIGSVLTFPLFVQYAWITFPSQSQIPTCPFQQTTSPALPSPSAPLFAISPLVLGTLLYPFYWWQYTTKLNNQNLLEMNLHIYKDTLLMNLLCLLFHSFLLFFNLLYFL